MFIVGDETHSQSRIPWVTGSLILLNVAVFLGQQKLGEKFTYGYSLIPVEIAKGRDLVKPQNLTIKVPYHSYGYQGRLKLAYKEVSVRVPQHRGPVPIYLTLLTSMFMHGSWGHLLGNMWFLGIFGRNVETALNHGRFLTYYLICGVAGGLAHTFSDLHSVVPCLGASGAISGVMGSYLAIYPFNKLKIWLGLFFGIVELPAVVVLGFWFVVQYVSAIASKSMGTIGGVAFFDHLGGFGAGIVLIFGTIAYLKWQLAHLPVEEATAVEAEPEPAPEPAAESFENFLPPKPAFVPPPPLPAVTRPKEAPFLPALPSNGAVASAPVALKRPKASFLPAPPPPRDLSDPFR